MNNKLGDTTTGQGLVSNTFDTYSIELDWEKYFQEFCNVHGKYPVVYNDKLLFYDGWMYSADNWEGPEYPPPKNKEQLIQLISYYWKRRYIIVQQEYDNLYHYIQGLEDLMRDKALPIFQRTEYRGDDGKMVTGTQQLDILLFRKRLEWLKDDIDNCERKLALVKNGNLSILA